MGTQTTSDQPQSARLVKTHGPQLAMIISASYGMSEAKSVSWIWIMEHLLKMLHSSLQVHKLQLSHYSLVMRVAAYATAFLPVMYIVCNAVLHGWQNQGYFHAKHQQGVPMHGKIAV